MEGYCAHAEERNGAGNHILISRQDPFQNRSIPALKFLYHSVAKGFTHISLLAQEERTRHRNIGEREDEGTQDGEENGKRHRTEHLALDAHKRHQRNVNYHDDDFAKCRTLADARSGIMNLLIHLCLRKTDGSIGRISRLPLNTLHAQMGHNSLYDNDGRIDYHTEIDGSERHQIAVDSEGLHHAESKEHAERNDARHNQSGTPVAQEDNQHEDNDESAFYQVSGDGSLHTVNQVGSVDKGFDNHALGQGFLNLLYAQLHIPDNLLKVFALQHDGYSGNHFALAISGNGSETGGMTQLNLRHITYLNRSAVYGLHGDICHIFQTLHHAYAADEILVGIFLYVTSARVGVILFERIKHLAHSQIAGVELIRIDGHLILLHIASPAAHFSHARGSRELFSHNPVLDGSQLGERIFVLVALLGAHGIMVNLAQSGSNRSHLGFHIFGQIFLHLGQHLAHLRTCPVDICIIIKNEGDDRESASRDASALLEFGDVGERHFYRSSYVLLHLLCSERRRLGDNLHLIVGNIRRRIERKMDERNDAPDDEGYRENSHHQLVADGVSNQFLKHNLFFFKKLFIDEKLTLY